MVAALVLAVALVLVGMAPKIADALLGALCRRAPEVDEHEHIVREPAVTDGNPHPSVTRPRFPQTEEQAAIVRRLRSVDPIREDGAP